MTEDNTAYYKALATPPPWALKTIQAGRLKGRSDISPQWRYQAMTEQFGPCGVGWKWELVNTWAGPASDDQVFAFAHVNVYIKHEGEWSDPIPGTGGSMLVTKESSGLHSSDEGFKMAITDALSVALKFLGVAADVYAGQLDSKYQSPPKPAAAKPAAPATQTPAGLISTAQNGKLWASAKDAGLDDAAIHAWILIRYEKEHVSELTKDEASQVIEAIIDEQVPTEPMTDEREAQADKDIEELGEGKPGLPMPTKQKAESSQGVVGAILDADDTKQPPPPKTTPVPTSTSAPSKDPDVVEEATKILTAADLPEGFPAKDSQGDATAGHLALLKDHAIHHGLDLGIVYTWVTDAATKAGNVAPSWEQMTQRQIYTLGMLVLKNSKMEEKNVNQGPGPKSEQPAGSTERADERAAADARDVSGAAAAGPAGGETGDADDDGGWAELSAEADAHR